MRCSFERKRVFELRLDFSLLRAPRYVFVLSCLCLSKYLSVLFTLPVCSVLVLALYSLPLYLHEVFFYFFWREAFA
jgi:hypothetical protein